MSKSFEIPIQMSIDGRTLDGGLARPPDARGLIIFAHGSGSSRHSPRNRFVAAELQSAGLATLLFDLLTPEEDRDYQHRFDIGLLTHRLAAAIELARQRDDCAALPFGCFGASTGAAAALMAASALPDEIRTVVSRGGRPDLAMPVLASVRAPTLLIVGGADHEVLRLNRLAQTALTCANELAIIPGATHLFEEPGALEHAARLAAGWFGRWLGPAA